MPDPAADAPVLAFDALAGLPAGRTLVLTVNNRLARRLLVDLAARLGPDRGVAEAPRIAPLSAWLDEAAAGLAFAADAPVAAHRLDAFASLWLWERTIRDAEAERVLLDAGQAARLARDADLLVDEWDIAVPPELETDEYRRFRVWRERYRARLRDSDAEDANLGYETVLRQLQAGRVAVPAHVVLAGFADVPARLRRLAAALRAAGAEVAWLAEPDDPPGALTRLEAADRAAEWRAAAAWAAGQLARRPDGRYAIVAARLDADAPLARRALRRAFDAAGLHAAFNVAVGRPLSEWPAARAGLAWLDALAGCVPGEGCPAATLGAALLAGHCAGDAAEASPRAALDAGWRLRARIRLYPDQWEAALRQAAPRLAQAWADAREAWAEAGRQAACDTWAQVFRRALAALGFPGERPLDSTGHQVCEALDAALQRYAALAATAPPLAAGQAVGLLRRLLRDTPFQPQRDPGARLDVLGLLEAEGGRWDGMWMLGLNDEVLPAAPQPNPLLPAAALRRADAPRATPERERRWAGELFAALCRGASEVTVSHARLEGEREMRPSPLIAGLPAAPVTEAEPAAAPPLPRESLRDEQGPPLPPGRGTSGGLDVLDTQSRNPMWAFVRHRLGGRALPDYADIATVNVRGQFLHAALERVWRMLPDQEALHEALAAGRLAGLLQAAVADAAERELRAYAPALRELECARAGAVLAAWMDLEAQRLPFAVEQVEHEYAWGRGALALTLRLDRMDRLPDGRVVVVDYKTGAGRLRPESDWARERPVNLQMPFYASVLAAEAPRRDVAGLVLAQVHAREVSARGLADADIGLEGVAAPGDLEAFGGLSWQALLARWRGAIEALADEYAAGVAANVARAREDLRYCDALPFLRLEEAADD